MGYISSTVIFVEIKWYPWDLLGIMHDHMAQFSLRDTGLYRVLIGRSTPGAITEMDQVKCINPGCGSLYSF